MDAPSPVVIKKKRHSFLMRYRIGQCARAAASDGTRFAGEREALLRHISGAFPNETGAPVIIAACNALYYREFAPTFLKSIDRLGKPERFHLHLCEPDQEILADVRKLSDELQHVHLSWTWDDGFAARLPHYPTIYYAAARFLIAPEILKATRSTVLCLDIDGIARKPVTEALLAIREDADVVLIKRQNERKIVRKVLASALAINPTPNGIDFADALGRALSAMLHLHPRYHVDQIGIHLLVRQLEKEGRLKTAQMPKSLADFDFDEESVIWTAKGWKRKNSERYRAEMAKVS